MRIAVTGAGGQLGFELARALERHEAVLLDQAMLDVTDEAACSGVLSDIRADVVIHAAAWTDVDGCERQPERAHAVNVQGTRNVVRAAGTALTILISTDYVFDGALGRAYVETDVPAPV
ncbi:MAG TPA: sugar nucleotide-binding protein, partial [Actinomycetota bacterium]|nr:sugar nucleotide-binding protein [Actinomycetota bacterium]